jgi:hypothetical protein
MIDCADDVLGYHNDETTLPQEERTAMAKRRDANRDRLKDGLEKKKNPQPFMYCKQGSYAMLTMVQHPENHYDIDDGVYFEKDKLKGSNDGEMSALDARKMVRDAVDDGGFAKDPETLPNCVRIYYAAGYHVDMPVYRRRKEKDLWGKEVEIFELASANWKRSDARLVTDWFDDENQKQSPDKDNGRQMRRMCREIKKFSQSRASWEGQIASGFVITKLVTECYKPNVNREDSALRDTMAAIRDRLNSNLVVKHPTTPDETISKGNDDPKIRFLREKLDEALKDLAVLDEASCTRENALKAWDKVFATKYFSARLPKSEDSDARAGAPAVLTSGILKSVAASAEPQAAVRKEGGGRFA